MFFSINIPVADFRNLLKDKGGKLEVPKWGAPSPQAKFMKGFGAIQLRRSNSKNFFQENYYADCCNFIKVDKKLYITPHKENPLVKIEAILIYRRFFFDGFCSGRFEIGFRLNEMAIAKYSSSKRSDETNLYDAEYIAEQIMDLALKIDLLDTRVIKCTAYTSQESLKEGYIQSTTRKEYYDVDTLPVSLARPFIVIRAIPETPLCRPRDQINVILNEYVHSTLIKSGKRTNDFDTLLIQSEGEITNENPHEQLTRLFFTQLSILEFIYETHFKDTGGNIINSSQIISKSLQIFIERMKVLEVNPDKPEEVKTNEIMKSIISNIAINPDGMAKEIANSDNQGKGIALRNVLNYFDNKLNIAIAALGYGAGSSLQ